MTADFGSSKVQTVYTLHTRQVAPKVQMRAESDQIIKLSGNEFSASNEFPASTSFIFNATPQSSERFSNHSCRQLQPTLYPLTCAWALAMPVSAAGSFGGPEGSLGQGPARFLLEGQRGECSPRRPSCSLETMTLSFCR